MSTPISIHEDTHLKMLRLLENSAGQVPAESPELSEHWSNWILNLSNINLAIVGLGYVGLPQGQQHQGWPKPPK